MKHSSIVPIVEQALGSGRHHAYVLISRSFAHDATPTEVVDVLLTRLAQLSLFPKNSKIAQEQFWQTFAGHPDLLRADPERPILRKEDVERFREHSLYPPTFARRRLLLIERAERMNNQSANSLLKTLEEPQAECVFVLTTSRPHALPSTILSRCQKIVLPAWDEKQAATLQLEKEDLLFLERMFSESNLREMPRVFALETLNSHQKCSISASQLSELSIWADQCGRRYSAELLRDALVEKTSIALKEGTLSHARALSTFALINAWVETDALNPTNSFWLMRILLTLTI